MSVRINVSVKDEYFDRLNEVASSLIAHGFAVNYFLGNIGVITGTMSQDKLNCLDSVEGVLAVENMDVVKTPTLVRDQISKRYSRKPDFGYNTDDKN